MAVFASHDSLLTTDLWCNAANLINNRQIKRSNHNLKLIISVNRLCLNAHPHTRVRLLILPLSNNTFSFHIQIYRFVTTRFEHLHFKKNVHNIIQWWNLCRDNLHLDLGWSFVFDPVPWKSVYICTKTHFRIEQNANAFQTMFDLNTHTKNKVMRVLCVCFFVCLNQCERSLKISSNFSLTRSFSIYANQQQTSH